MINLNHIQFGYRSKQTILKDLTLQIAPGHIYGLLGRNGVGKTSLMHILSGLRSPDSGECTVSGFIPQKRSVAFLRQTYFLPGEVHFPPGSLSRYLDLQTPFYPAFDLDLFYDLLNGFGLEKELFPAKLSLGQRKQIAISFALATRAKVLLLDEPTNALDIPAKKIFRKMIAGTLQEDQILIISTHQVTDLESLIDHVLILDGAELVVDSSVEKIINKFAFKTLKKGEDPGDVVYRERSLKGDQLLAINTGGEDTRFDMELFFNAVITEKTNVTSVLKMN